MDKAKFVFEKLALSIKEINTLDDLYHTDKKIYNYMVEQMQENPRASAGRYFKSNGKPYLFIDHRLAKNSPEARVIRRHELTHYIRDFKKPTRTAKWLEQAKTKGIDPIRLGIGNFVEETAAGRKMFTRTPEVSSKATQFISKYIYPSEVGLGSMISKNVKFNTLRKLVKLIK